MVSTQTRTETLEDEEYGNRRFVQTSIDEDEEVSGNRFSMPSFNSSWTTTTETEPAFEIEKEYNGQEEERQEDFRVAKDAMHEVERKQQVIAPGVPKTRTKLSPRLKIMMTVYSLVVALLIGFAIYNAVAISSGVSGLASKKIEVSASAEVINNLQAQYNELGTEQTIKDKVAGEFIDADGSNTIIIDKPQLDAVKVYEAPTNWFDKLCEFFSGLF